MLSKLELLLFKKEYELIATELSSLSKSATNN